MDRLMLAMTLDVLLAEQVIQHGIKRVFPRQLTHLAAEEEVIGALIELERRGQLVSQVELHCPEGHRYWAGPKSRLSPTLPQCTQCDSPPDLEDVEITLHFTISPAWESLLSKKKTRSNAAAR